MIKINNILSTLKQYNLNNNQLSNLIKQKQKNRSIKQLNIKNLIKNLGLQLTQQNKAIIQELIKLDLPLQKSLFLQINDFLKKFEHPHKNLKTKIKTFILLKKLNLPPTPKFFNLFKSSVNLEHNGKEQLAQLLNKFVQSTNHSLISNTTSNLNNKYIKSQTTESFNKLGLKPTSEHKKIIDQMIKFKLPLTKKNFKQIKGHLKGLKFTNQNLKTIILIQKLDLPISQPVIKLINQLNFSEKTNLEDALIKLTKQSIITNQNKQFTNLIFPKLREILMKNPKLLSKLKTNLSSPQFEKLKEKLNFSTSQENNILKQGLKHELKEIIITPNNLNSENIKQAITNLNLNHKDNQLFKFLFQLNNTTTSEKITNNSQKLLQQLISNSAINHNNPVIMLFLPFLFNQKLNIAQIKVQNNNSKSSQQDQKNNLNLSFAVNTESLGEIRVNLNINNRKSSGKFIVNNKKTAQLIKQNLNKFKSRLKKLNYNINNITCQLTDKPLITDNVERTQFTKIDFKI